MKHKMIKSAILLMLIGIFISCKEKETVNPEEPEITTLDIFTITGRGTVFTGRIESEGSSSITEIGVAYGSSTEPKVTDNKESIDMSTVKAYPHNYEILLRGGFPGTGDIYVRAYAISGGNAYYGQAKKAR